ncbi:unnamed protein product [Menidia menidia]|uniref:(Atlantic silverside) hypothetical protein n=1 Tax=Menidia menidia TaxID=238744 RepID=A0A8S4BEL3_9TELE|nr:unnamed protein product [Menidia menidia]
MPHSCAAWKCTNRFTVETRSHGLTFHRFPKDIEQRRVWETAVRRAGFSATPSSMLCSEHFRPEDFDRTGQTVRIRAGAVPSVIRVRAHNHRPVVTRTSQTSKKAQETLPDCSQRVQEAEPLPPPNVDHSYALPSSHEDLKARLREALARGQGTNKRGVERAARYIRRQEPDKHVNFDSQKMKLSLASQTPMALRALRDAGYSQFQHCEGAAEFIEAAESEPVPGHPMM